jgi:hypothetical protein
MKQFESLLRFLVLQSFSDCGHPICSSGVRNLGRQAAKEEERREQSGPL